jgi:transcriptional regulator with XRE-family HTH domain
LSDNHLPALRTAVIEGPLAFQMRRFAAAQANDWGLQILNLPQVAARLAGGFAIPASVDQLELAIRENAPRKDSAAASPSGHLMPHCGFRIDRLVWPRTTLRSESLSEDDWVDAAWIRDRLGGTGKTQRDVARVLGIDASGVSRLLDGRRKLGADEARTIRAFFDGAAPGAASATDVRANESMTKRKLPGPKPRTTLSADIPILGPIVPDGPDHFRLPGGSPAEHRPCPPQCVGVTGAFGIFLPDDSLAPRAWAGEVLYVHPNKPAIANADVCVRFKARTSTHWSSFP